MHPGYWCPPAAAAAIEPMRPGGPIITVNDYDKDDEPGCGCENCTSPWGAEVLPLLMRAGRT